MGWHRGFRKSGTEKPTYDGIEFDSAEEIAFYKWLTIAVEKELIGSFDYHPAAIEVIPEYSIEYDETKQLKTKMRVVHRKKVLLQEATYTTDFILHDICPLLKEYFRESQDGTYWVDVKSSFMNTGESKFFSLLRKVIWKEKSVFVNKIVPEEFFHDTFCPDNVRIGKSGKELKAYVGCPTLKDFLDKDNLNS